MGSHGDALHLHWQSHGTSPRSSPSLRSGKGESLAGRTEQEKNFRGLSKPLVRHAAHVENNEGHLRQQVTFNNGREPN